MSVPAAPSARADAVFAPGLMKDKVLFVTGGGSGIGLGICLSYARLGARVAICGRTEKKLAEAAAAIRRAGAPEVLYATADVRKPDELEAAFNMVGEKWGKIDVFVANAAGNFMSLAEDITSSAFNTVVGIDLLGTFNAAKAALPWLRKAAADGSGATMLAISATMFMTATPFQGHAAAAKAGINSLTKTLAAEWADSGIRVVSIAPGPIAGTEGGPTGRVFGSMTGNKREQEKAIRNRCPIGRDGTVDDIANAAVFLGSPAGSFITGTDLIVDGLNWQAMGVSPIIMAKDKLRKAMTAQRDGRQRGTGSKGHAGDTQSKL